MKTPRTVDEWAAAFFQAEAPSPWPPAPRVNAAMPVRRSAGTSQGRVALALSLLILLAGGWFLAGRMTRISDRPVNFDGTTATRPADMHLKK